MKEKQTGLVREDQLDDPFFARTLVAWQKQHGRHILPWQNTRDAYSIWLSEIMLQQTQVATVIPYFERFLTRFPDVYALAAASQESVMALWSGLGYYSRARNLHRSAQMVVEEYGGIFPSDPADLEKLPGVGRSTAAAIAVFSHGVRAAILDGNVVRVLSRIYGIADPVQTKPVKDKFWRLAQSLLPEQDMESYTQGLMDLGATLCIRSKPRCGDCPFMSRCVAFLEKRVEELPTRKPKKTVPAKYIAMLVVMKGKQVLLERRPEFGIWGGLFSLPEWTSQHADSSGLDDAGELSDLQIAELTAPFGRIAFQQRLPAFTHSFTHFRLHVTPYLIKLSSRIARAEQAGYVWYELDDLENAALPAPVRKLLLRMNDADPVVGKHK